MLIDLLFPKKCLGCAKDGCYLCKSCVDKQENPKPRCIVCERPSIDGETHYKCRSKWVVDGAVSIWSYNAVIRKGLISLKYRFASEVAKELAFWSARYLKNNFTALPANAVIIPVPLHNSREKWRGFNQSAEITKLVANEIGWKFIPDFVIRTNKNTPQATIIKKEARKSNLKNTFVFNNKYRNLPKTTPIIIFDDITTTGTTLREVGKVLKRFGFEKVWGLTIAR